MKHLWKRGFSLVLALIMIVGIIPMSVFAKVADKPLSEADGIVWLYDDNGGASKEFEDLVYALELDNLIRKAVGADEDDDSILVTYEGANIGNFFGLATKGEELADQVKDILKSKQLIVFAVDGVDKNIAVRTIQGAAITVGEDEKIVISAAGAPADLAAQVDAILANINDYITIEHNGEADLSKTRHTVETELYDYSWPVAGEGDVVAGKVTVTLTADDNGYENSGIAEIILHDNRAVKEDQYVVSAPNKAEETQSLYYYAGEEAPAAPALPTSAYYSCTQWEVASVDGDVTVYVPNWTANVDNNGNGVADQEESFTVTYTVDGQVVYTQTVKYGTTTPKPATNPTKVGASFGGWVDSQGNVAAKIVTGDAEYVPNWTTDPVVTYEVYDNNFNLLDTYTLTAKKVSGQFYVEDITYMIGPMDGYIWSGWEDFNGAVDYSAPITHNVTVFCVYSPDADGNGAVDGTATDPYYVYEYYLANSTTPSLVEQKLASDNFDPQSVAYPADKLGEHDKFAAWTVSGPVAGEGTLTYTCTPNIFVDSNDNGIPDEEEMDTVTFGFADFEFVDGKIKITEDGYVGWIEITGLMYDEGTKTLSFSYNPNKTVVKASPLWKNDEVGTKMSKYIASITIDGEAKGAYDEDYNLVCAPVKAVRGVPVTLATNVAVVINYADVDEIAAKDPAGTVAPGQDSYTEEEVYNAAVSSPAYNDDDITVQYLARQGGTITVSLEDLKDKLDSGVTSAVVSYLPDSYDFEVSTVYADVTAPVSGRSATVIANEFFTQLLDRVLNEDGSINNDEFNKLNFNVELDTLEAKLEAEADLHKFGQVAVGKKSVTEKLDITYKTESQFTNAKIDLTIHDNRAETKISAKDVEYYYGEFTDADLLKNVKLTEAGKAIAGEVKLDRSYEGKSVGTYTVTATFEGNADYAGSKATFTLTVKKVTPEIKMAQLITVLKGGEYNPYPTVDPKSAEIIHVIAGIATSELEIDGKALTNDHIFALKDDTVEVKAWVKLPALYTQVLTDMGIKLGTFDDLETIEENLNKEIENPIKKKVQSILQNALDKLPGKIQNMLGLDGVNIDLQVRIDTLGQVAHPIEEGIYMNLAANLPGLNKLIGMYATVHGDVAQFLNDKNYDPAYATGFIVITPMMPIPNSGGVQLFYKDVNDTQNVFVFENEGARDLKVAVKGVELEGAKPTYYGITTRADATKAVPANPGLYVATYNYVTTVHNDVTGEDEIRRLGSDVAVIVIKQTPVDMEIVGKTVTYDGNAHLPEIKVTGKNGIVTDAAVTVISGSVNSGSATSVRDLEANINIDFPAALDSKWAAFWNYLGKDVPETATPEDVVKFLEWCKKNVNDDASAALDILEGLGIPDGYVDKDIETKVENGIEDAAVTLQNALDRATFYFDKLIVEVDKIASKAEGHVSLSIKDLDELNYSATGYYLFAGIVTDPDYTVAAGKGMLIIKSADTYVMYETHEYYDGKEHSVKIDDETCRDGIIMIVDNNGDYTKITFDLDNDMTKVLETVLKKAGYTLYDGSDAFVGTVYKKGEAKIGDYTDEILEAFEAQIKAKIVSRLSKLYPAGSDELNNAVTKVVEELAERKGGVIAKLSKKLQELDKLENDTLIIINGSYPVEVGEYDFYGYDYDVAATSATLYIEPNEIHIVPVVTPAEVAVGGTVEITYQVTLNGEVIDANHEMYKALKPDYMISGAATLDAALQAEGEYTITPIYSQIKNCEITKDTATLKVVPAIADFNPFQKAKARLDLESKVRIVIDVWVKKDENGEYMYDADYIQDLGLLVWPASAGITNETGLVGTGDQYNLNAELGTYQDSDYKVFTDGIPAKEYNDDLTMRLVVKLANGQYAYSPVFKYKVADYCYSMEQNSNVDEKLRNTCIALLNYGAEAQTYFKYNTNNLVNAKLTAEQKAKVTKEVAESYLNATEAVDKNKTTNIPANKTVFQIPQGRLVLNGSTDMSVVIKLDEQVRNNASEMKLYYWTYAQYKNSDQLSIIESQHVDFAKVDPENYGGRNIRAEYSGQGTAAKDLGEGVYFCAYVKTNNGEEYYSPVFVYSVETYCSSMIDTVDEQGDLFELVRRLAAYGECAKKYFDSLK